MSIKQTTSTPKGNLPLGRTRTYNEIVEFLNSHWTAQDDAKSADRMKKLDKALGSPSSKVPTVLITGTNGKSLTTHFATKLFKEEGLIVGALYAPHILTYNERFFIDTDFISNKNFTDISNEVINTSEENAINATTQELLIAIGLLYFAQNNVAVAIMEVEKGGISHPLAAVTSPKIVAITRVTAQDADEEGQALDAPFQEYIGLVKEGTHLVSADQNKTNLKRMSDYTKDVKGIWEMPIRKLTVLPYPFEQLHGRCAALAERIASIFINQNAPKELADQEDSSLLMKKKGQRGRPTLEAKRQSELNPKRTLEHFWKETINSLAGRFQIFDKEKPTILIDNASNIDAFKNFLLGVRLMHYQRSLKGLALVVGCYQENLDYQEFLRQVRYFFKKTSGHIILCPVIPKEGVFCTSWDPEKVANDMKDLKIKARAASNFKEAFEFAKKSVTDRHGLVAIVGCSSLLAEYWNSKGIKKLQG